MKVVVAEKLSPAALGLLRENPGWTLLTPDDVGGKLAESLGDCDALIVRSVVKVTSDLLEHAPQLRVIGRAGIGVDNIDLEAATRRGIAVMNTPGANAVAVAEHTLGMMLALARHLCRAHELTRAGKWEKKSLEGTELRGKVLGILGLGRIGMEVARRARAFGMNLVGHDPYVTPEIARENAVEPSGFDEVLAQADYLTLHLALTSQTAGIINAAAIARMKRGVRIVNCARGELIDENALADALRSGHVSGAALDVFAPEPPKSSPLLKLENVVLTPHIGGSTREAQEAVGVQIAQQVREYLSRGIIQNAVNVPSVSYEEYVEMQPFIGLGERLGAFLAQVAGEGGGLQEITVRYSGRLTTWKTPLLRNAVVKGVLNSILAEEVNLVNAAALAEDRGVRLRDSAAEKPSGGTADVLTVILRIGERQHLGSGTVLHRRSPRLLHVDGIDIEAPLERDLLYLRNCDVPGVVGRVGTILGDHQINIANFSLGRAEARSHAVEPGGGAMDSQELAAAVIQVDTVVPDSVLAELRKVPAVTIARSIRL